MRTWDKDPNASLPWQFDWTQWLVADTITGTPVVTVDAGLTSSGQTNTTTKVNITLSGGTVGVTYKVACKITTAAGLIDERTILIRVTER